MILAVMRTSWELLRRDRAALALTFAVPIVFFSIFALIFGGAGDDVTNRVRLVVADEDGSERAARLVAALEAEPALVVLRAPASAAGVAAPPPPYDRAAALEAVRAGRAPVALVVPRGFGAAPIGFGPQVGERPRLELVADRADPIAPKMVEGLLQKTITSGMGDLFLAGGIRSLDPIVGFTPEQRERLEALVSEARGPGGGAGEGAAGGGLPIDIVTSDVQGAEKASPMIAFYAAGLGVMFLLFTAAGAGGALIEEAESGTLDRLLSTRLTISSLLAGKLAYLTALGVTQLVVMFVWGWLVFGLDLPPHVDGLLLMAVPTAAASSAFGLVLASICRTRKQLVAASNLVILSISALGGSMFPRFLMPEALQKVSLVAFNAWALEGFLDVFWRGAPLTAALPEVAVLFAWTAVFFLVARRVARRWEAI
jgi:ABC-2 type transport system permease protein